MTEQQYTVSDVARICEGRFTGSDSDALRVVSQLAPMADADESSISWVVDPKYGDLLAKSQAAAVIGTEEVLGGFGRGLVCDDPELALAKLLAAWHERIMSPKADSAIHESAVVDDSAELGEGVSIGATCVVQAGVKIGAGSKILSGVTLGAGVSVGQDSLICDGVVVYPRSQIGNNVIIHAGAVIGADGFGYIFRNGQHIKLQHIGNVVIEDEVEIGANACIDRGKVSETRIGRGTKIDNLVHVAHNVQIGPLNIITALVGIAGSTKLGTGVVIGGQAGLRDNISIGDGAQIGGQSAVVSNVEPGAKIWGYPAREARSFMREVTHLKSIGAMKKQLADLEARLQALESE